VQNPDIRPIFGKPARTGAEKADVSGETLTYSNASMVYGDVLRDYGERMR